MSLTVGTAIAAAAVVGAGATVYSANKASNAQKSAANQSNQTALDQYNQTRADQAPWRTQGANALTQLTGNLAKGFTPTDFEHDPGYQFELDQGMQGLDRSAASRGRLYSGAQMKAADTFATNFASTKYGDAYTRWLQGNNELAAVAGVGQTATTATDQAAMNYGTQFSNNTNAAGNVSASGYLSSGNALTNAINGGTAAYLRYYTPTPAVTNGSNPNGYNGTVNNPSAYVGP